MASLSERLQRLKQARVKEERELVVTPTPPQEPELKAPEEAPSVEEREEERFYKIKHLLFDYVVRNIDQSLIESRDEARLRARIDELIQTAAAEKGIPISRTERLKLISEFVDELLGFGPIEPFLNDPAVSRIIVSGPTEIYVERMGRLERVDRRFKDDEHVISVIRKIGELLGQRVDSTMPILERRLPDGSRVHAMIPPVAQRGPTLTIQKTAQNPFEVVRRERISQQAQPMMSFMEIKDRIHERLIAELDQEAIVAGDRDRVREQIEATVNAFVAEQNVPLSRAERSRLVIELLNDIVGLGPLEEFLNDPEVTEIMVNGPNQIYIEKGGRVYLTDKKFRDDNHVLQIIEKIVAPLGRRVDESSPMVDARLPDGSRVNIIIPPIALNGPCITIRKFRREPFTVNDLINFGTLTPEVAEFLRACVQARLNIIVSGGTASGKTTTLNVLSSFISPNERIITIEDAAELQLQQEHVVRLEARPPNIEGKGEITIRDLVRNALRMRPDRIIVGEVRGGEALDMLQAMNTGHEGSMTTIHANNPRELISRLETMVLMAGEELPLKAIREQIAGAIDIIVHQARLRDGSRRVQFITEITGMEGDVITMQDIFVFEQQGIDEHGRIVGRLVPTGIRPKCYDRILAAGIKLPLDLFRPARARQAMTAAE